MFLLPYLVFTATLPPSGMSAICSHSMPLLVRTVMPR
jgi:hypothetical protein